ncbi:MAG: type II toxin-antitoxin system HicB family antitoxin [Chloroflexi bacterium]|nr:type II toxin-antitoxin system HicB family antitoxin [Chloroflexota bacterium]MCC6893171.1 type II toxin-antitoxin system HicB family antitoxin [Anaerolineae bacterium]
MTHQESAKDRQVLLYTDEDGIWIAEVPSLRGCGSDGKTREEAIERVKEAIELWIEAAVDHHEEIPEDYTPISIERV